MTSLRIITFQHIHYYPFTAWGIHIPRV